MSQIEHFVAGGPGEENEVVARLRRPVAHGVAGVYVEAYTDVGDMVLVPYCQGPAVVREILGRERRAVALNFDPLSILIAQVAVAPVLRSEINAAAVHLGDSQKQGMRATGVALRRYLEGLYATTCPACLRPAIAHYFIWDREQVTPVAKYLRCPACSWDGQAAVEEEDRARLADIPARGMHYHYVLDRVADRLEAAGQRARLESLLKLYTPRNLYALAELTLRIESLFPEGRQRKGLNALLLDCLDRCSSLNPVPTSTAQQRGLSRPSRFVERNVWYALEEAIARQESRRVVGPVAQPSWELAESLQAYQAEEGEAVGLLGQGLVRDLVKALPPRTVRLILTSPPPLDPAAWTLSYFWGAWLFGAEAVSSLRPLLRQRTADPAWYAGVMSRSLRALAGLLRDDGRLVLVLSEQSPAVLEALLLAASGARLELVALLQQGADYRLELRGSELPITFPQPVSLGQEPLDALIRRHAAAAAVEAIQARGEPVAWPTLHAAILSRLAREGLLVRALEPEGESVSPFDLVAEQIQDALRDRLLRLSFRETLSGSHEGDDRWWLCADADVARPLSDRVEEAARKVLEEGLTLTETDFATRIYRQFSGILTPEAELIAICLRAYGQEVKPGSWQLRPEDRADVRQAERLSIVSALMQLGGRLGFVAEAWDPFDAVWFEGEQAQAAFVVRPWANVGEALDLGESLCLSKGQVAERLQGAQPYLVIPGGRAALVNYKLTHNPLWQQAVEGMDAARPRATGGGGRVGVAWRFIKYRHVRHLVDQPEVDAYALQTIVGLDPIVEKESAQLSFL